MIHLYPTQSRCFCRCVLRSVTCYYGRGPRVVVSTGVRGSVPVLGGLKETKLFLPHPRVKVSIVGSLRDREVACSASDLQGSNFESCVWRTVSSQSSHHPQEVLLAQFSLYVHKGGLKPDSFHFISFSRDGFYQFCVYNDIYCTFKGQYNYPAEQSRVCKKQTKQLLVSQIQLYGIFSLENRISVDLLLIIVYSRLYLRPNYNLGFFTFFKILIPL